MAVIYERLLNFPVPEIRQSVVPKDLAFYALSIGVGLDPTDPRQLRLVDPASDIQAVPSMALVLGYPGFWLGDPATGVDAVRVMHGEQELIVHHPLPPSGDVLGRTRITSLVDRGHKKGSLLTSERDIVNCSDGTVLATVRQVHVLRGDGGFGGPPAKAISRHRVPERSPDTLVELPTRPEQALLYRLNGDMNPLHIDANVAMRAGFPRPILHGLCTFGIVTHALLRALCDYDVLRLRAVAMRFTSPVFPGDTIRTEVWHDGSFRAWALERNTIVIDNGISSIAR